MSLLHKALVVVILINGLNCFKEWWEDSKALELTENNFYDHIGKNQFVLVKFYTTWCKFCRLIAPEYEILIDKVKESRTDILIARINSEANSSISRNYGISSFPQLVLFAPEDKDIYLIYSSNDRKASAIFGWLTAFCDNVVNEIVYLPQESENFMEASTEDIKKETTLEINGDEAINAILNTNLAPISKNAYEDNLNQLRKKYLSLIKKYHTLNLQLSKLIEKIDNESALQLNLKYENEKLHIGELKISASSIIYYFLGFIGTVTAIAVFIKAYRKIILE